MQDTVERSRDGLTHTVSHAPPSRQLPFTFFTQSDARISRRLKFLGRTLQVISIAPIVQFIDALFKVARLSRLTPDGAIDMTLFTQIAVSNIGFSASLYFAGRALLQRKAWGAYFTIATALFPAILLVLQQDVRLARGRTFGTGVSVIILMLVASVWNELHPKQNVAIEPDVGKSPQTLRDRMEQETTTHLPCVAVRNGLSDNDSLAPVALRNRASDNDSLAI